MHAYEPFADKTFPELHANNNTTVLDAPSCTAATDMICSPDKRYGTIRCATPNEAYCVLF